MSNTLSYPYTMMIEPRNTLSTNLAVFGSSWPFGVGEGVGVYRTQATCKWSILCLVRIIPPHSIYRTILHKFKNYFYLHILVLLYTLCNMCKRTLVLRQCISIYDVPKPNYQVIKTFQWHSTVKILRLQPINKKFRLSDDLYSKNNRRRCPSPYISSNPYHPSFFYIY